VIGKWFITPHAVQRWREIRSCGLDYHDALIELILVAEKAKFKRELSDGISLFRSPKPHRWRLIVSTRLAGKPQLVTVLRHGGGS
jgi:hypothetical protein